MLPSAVVSNMDMRTVLLPGNFNMECTYSDLVDASDYSTVQVNDQALGLDNVSSYSTSPQSCLMYETEDPSRSLAKVQLNHAYTKSDDWNLYSGMNSVTTMHVDPIYEGYPGDYSLNDSFNSFCDSGRDSLWGSQESDFFDIDVSSPLQNQDDIAHGPTLAELNMEDSQPIVDSFYHPDLQKQIVSQPRVVKVERQYSDIPAEVSGQTKPCSSQNQMLRPTHQECQEKKMPQEEVSHQLVDVKPQVKCEDPCAGSSCSMTKSASDDKTELRSLLKQTESTSKTDYSSLFLSKSHRTSLKNEDPVGTNESSMDRKWEEIKEYLDEEEEEEEKEREKEKEEKEQMANKGQSAVRSSGHDYTSTVFKQTQSVYSPKEEGDDEEGSCMDSNDEGFDSDHDDNDDDSEEDSESEEMDISSGVSLKVGKSRRSDSEDLTPNPRRLLHIGNELRKLNKIISDLTPVSELPVNARQKSRKEKNKLASRACRLKKKAQHEANKVKMHGLDEEYQRLRYVLSTIRQEIIRRAQYPDRRFDDTLTGRLDKLIKNDLGEMVGGHTPEFVNSVLEKTAAGSSSGGLTIKVK